MISFAVFFVFSVGVCCVKARKEVSERQEMVQRERQEASSKVQQESTLEKEKLDEEVARLRQEKRKLDGLNRELNDRTHQVGTVLDSRQGERKISCTGKSVSFTMVGGVYVSTI